MNFEHFSRFFQHCTKKANAEVNIIIFLMVSNIRRKTLRLKMLKNSILPSWSKSCRMLANCELPEFSTKFSNSLRLFFSIERHFWQCKLKFKLDLVKLTVTWTKVSRTNEQIGKKSLFQLSSFSYFPCGSCTEKKTCECWPFGSWNKKSNLQEN